MIAQIKIFYSGISADLFRELIYPLRDLLGRASCLRWSLQRRWQNGPHLLFQIDEEDPFFEPRLLTEATDLIDAFLRENPSSNYDEKHYRALQARLNVIESASIDADVLYPNNSRSINTISVEDVSSPYESPAQWLSIFETDAVLRRFVLPQWIRGEDHDRFTCELLTLIACTYPPLPSDDPEINEYNGFLSYYSHYIFWRHGLNDTQRANVDAAFSSEYAEQGATLRNWIGDLTIDLHADRSRLRELSRFLLGHYVKFKSMADHGVIHARSPYSPDRAADPSALSDFHKRLFVESRPISPEFSGYRWLVNIAYRHLPLLGISPKRRQYLGYALNLIQRENSGTIAEVRQAMLALA